MLFLLLFTLAPVVHSEPISCPNGTMADPMSVLCYLFVNTPTDYLLAEDYCQQLGYQLGSVVNGEQNTLIAAEARDQNITGSLWIGMTSLLSNDEDWKWIDGSPVSFTNWKKNVTPIPNYPASCTRMDVSNNQWIASDCTELRMFFCTANLTNEQTTEITTTTTAAATELQTSTENSSVATTAKSTQISTTRKNSGTTGITKTPQTTTTRSPSKTKATRKPKPGRKTHHPLPFIPTLPPLPPVPPIVIPTLPPIPPIIIPTLPGKKTKKTTAAKRTTARIRTTTRSAHVASTTATADLGTPHGFTDSGTSMTVTEYGTSLSASQGTISTTATTVMLATSIATMTTAVPSETTTTATGTCAVGWTYFNGYCYWVRLGNEMEVDFGTDISTCQAHSSAVASIHSAEENQFILELAEAANPLACDIAIGFARDSPTSSFSWYDNTTVDYTNWVSGFPTEYNMGFAVMAINQDGVHCNFHPNGLWTNGDFSTCGVVCKKFPTAATAVPPTTVATAGPCEDGWSYFYGHCYLAILDNNVTLQYENATAICESRSSIMTSIHSAGENQFVAALAEAANQYVCLIAIGLVRDEPGREFYWLDNTAFDYTHWWPYSPSDEADNFATMVINRGPNKGHCNAMPNGDWINTHTKPNGVVCKKNVSCEAGWSYFNGHCYWVAVDETSRVFDPAVCELRSSMVASIHSAEENQFILGLPGATSQGVYDIAIGLVRDARGSPFYWLDNTTVDYTNWMSGVPEDSELDFAVIFTNQGGLIDWPNGTWWNDEPSLFGIVCKK